MFSSGRYDEPVAVGMHWRFLALLSVPAGIFVAILLGIWSNSLGQQAHALDGEALSGDGYPSSAVAGLHQPEDILFWLALAVFVGSIVLCKVFISLSAQAVEAEELEQQAAHERYVEQQRARAEENYRRSLWPDEQ